MKKTDRKNNSTIIFLLISLNTLAAMSIDIYLPSLAAITEYFNTSYSKVELTISLFMLGFGLSQIVCGPLSDRFGRKPIIFGGLGLYIISTAICFYSSSLHMLIIARIFQAIGACGATVTSFAIARDLFEGKECAKVLTYLTTTIGCVPIVAPIIGSYLVYWLNWRSNFIFLEIFSSLLLLVTYFKLPESNKFPDKFAIIPKKILINYQSIISNSQYRTFVICSIFSFTALFSFVANSPYYIIELGKTSPQYFSFLFAINALSLIIGGLLAIRLFNKISLKEVIFAGASIVLLGSIFMIIQMVIFQEYIFLFIGSMVICTFGIAFIMPAAMSGALALFPEKSGSASALTGCLRFLIASLIAYILSCLQMVSPLWLALIIGGCAVIIILRVNIKLTLQNRNLLQSN